MPRRSFFDDPTQNKGFTSLGLLTHYIHMGINSKLIYFSSGDQEREKVLTLRAINYPKNYPNL
jgi:hypothetical protein